jgi:hypothetical protein
MLNFFYSLYRLFFNPCNYQYYYEVQLIKFSSKILVYHIVCPQFDGFNYHYSVNIWSKNSYYLFAHYHQNISLNIKSKKKKRRHSFSYISNNYACFIDCSYNMSV